MLKHLKVLLVEDNRQMRAIIRTILSGFEIREVHGFGSVDEAKDALRHNTYDLVLIDYRLEDETGLELCRHIRRPNTGPNAFLPIIMISAHSERERIVDAINAGVDEFLVKPIRPVDVARRINAVVFKRRPFLQIGDYFGPDRRRFQRRQL